MRVNINILCHVGSLNSLVIRACAVILFCEIFYGTSAKEIISKSTDNNMTECEDAVQWTSVETKPWETCVRLPSDVVPKSYDILLNPNVKDGSFTGSIKIQISVLSRRKIIVLHSIGLIIKKKQLKIIQDSSQNVPSNTNVDIAEDFYYPKNEYYGIITTNSIEPGLYELALEYDGSLTDKIIGFYRSTYKDINDGSIRQIATSKFEPTYARQAFPCFDEPSFKVEFTISIVRPSTNNYIALSNMNQVSETVDSPEVGYTTVHFAKSVPMSTYLACFIVCDFDHLEPIKSNQGFPITVYARPGQSQNMNYTLNLANKTINFYVDYFGIEYPLPKLDLISIPDFVSGAMEHWGLVTFRETSVLFNPAVSSMLNKKLVALTVTHELAHMWFGNLVTMKWWNDLWLNEGFAGYIEYKGVHHSHPEWDIDTQFLIDDLHRVLSLDSVVSSHPIVQTVAHPDQITEIFDTISYSKGASVIRMLEHMMGPENFRAGISEYLRTFAYQNAETQDLWNHLEKKANGINITRVMGTFTCQMGYPVVNITQFGNVLTLTQQRFLADKRTKFDENESVYRYKWDIPLTYITSNNATDVHSTWLYLDKPSVKIVLPAGTSWIKFNYRQYGYYRVNYTPAGWQSLIDMLKNNYEIVTAADRAHLLDDAFSLARAGYLDYKTALDAIQYISKEDHFVPWIVTSNKLGFLQSILSSTPIYIKFRKFVQRILEPLATESLWQISPDQSYKERRRQLVVLNMACDFGVPSAVAVAHKKFTDWLSNPSIKPEAEIRSLVYTAGMSKAGEVEWEKVWQAYVKEEEPQEKVKLRSALASVGEPWLLNRLIDLSKDENNVRSQDFLIFLGTISDNPVGNPIVWDFVRDQWSYLVKRFTLNNRHLGLLIPRITSSFATQTKLNDLKAFLDANPEAGAGAAGRKIALERIDINIRWLSAHLPELSAAL